MVRMRPIPNLMTSPALSGSSLRFISLTTSVVCFELLMASAAVSQVPSLSVHSPFLSSDDFSFSDERGSPLEVTILPLPSLGHSGFLAESHVLFRGRSAFTISTIGIPSDCFPLGFRSTRLVTVVFSPVCG